MTMDLLIMIGQFVIVFCLYKFFRCSLTSDKYRDTRIANLEKIVESLRKEDEE